MLRFRKGLSGTSTSERLCILYAEVRGISEAVQRAYLARLEESGSIICDAQDLEPRGCAVKWARKSGHLYVSMRVNMRAPGSSFNFNWKIQPKVLAPKLYKNSPMAYRQEPEQLLPCDGRREGWRYGRRARR
jgi:hypothetical protein